VSLYLYLSLLCSDDGVCHPTTKQIRHDLGIASLTIVFEAILALETGGFILRRRQNLVALKSRRNVYQRPSCEYTVLRLLEAERLDALLRPSPGAINEMTVPAQALRDEWLKKIIDEPYVAFETADLETKREILLKALRAAVRPEPSASATG